MTATRPIVACHLYPAGGYVGLSLSLTLEGFANLFEALGYTVTRDPNVVTARDEKIEVTFRTATEVLP